MNFDSLKEQAPELIMLYGTKIITALLILFIGKWVAQFIADMVKKGMASRSVDSTVTGFARNIIFYGLLVVVMIAALGQIGIQTASFIAVIGAAGLAIGFALQGSLSNFAAGVLLILFKPLKIGDYVDAGGASGTVKDVSIFTTTLLTPDNKTIIIANGSVMDNNITNYSTQPQRRVDMIVGVSYEADLQQVKSELHALANADERVLKDKDVTVAVLELADSSVNLVFRPWVNSADYWPTKFDLTEQIKIRFDELGIGIPFPQMDVHLQNAA